jgi:prepilin-type processing-associated H-X9-DG protein
MDWDEYDWNGGEFVEGAWLTMMKPYYERFDMCLCPSTTKTWRDGVYRGPYTGWDFRTLWEGGASMWEWYPYYEVDGERSYGSYAKNTWISDGMELGDEESLEWFYRNVYVSNGNEIPLMGDSNFLLGFPTFYDEPANFRNHPPVCGCGGEINRWNADRHSKAINMVFLDWSARKVGLRELWMLKWNRQTTEAGVSGWGNLYVIPDPDDPEMWPEWMRD